jgi:hypothetical protein
MRATACESCTLVRYMLYESYTPVRAAHLAGLQFHRACISQVYRAHISHAHISDRRAAHIGHTSHRRASQTGQGFNRILALTANLAQTVPSALRTSEKSQNRLRKRVRKFRNITPFKVPECYWTDPGPLVEIRPTVLMVCVYKSPSHCRRSSLLQQLLLLSSPVFLPPKPCNAHMYDS